MVMAEGVAGTGLYERAEHAARIVRARTKLEPRIAIVLGSGLGGFADEFDEAVGIPYEEITGFARSTAQGHAGRLVIGKVDEVPVMAEPRRADARDAPRVQLVAVPVDALPTSSHWLTPRTVAEIGRAHV